MNMKKYLISLLLVFPLFVFAQTFDKDLYFGIQKDSDVTKLQEFLTEQGVYSGPVSGNFFSLTLQGVKSFQAKQGITPTSGYFGPKSRAKANLVLASQGVSSTAVTDESGSPTPVVTTSPKTTNDTVSALMAQMQLIQQQLNALQTQNQTLQTIQQQQATQTQTLQQIQTNTTPPPPPPAPSPTPTPASSPVHIPVKEIQITATFTNPTILTGTGLGESPVQDGGIAYISSYLGAAKIHFHYTYTIDGVIQSNSMFPLSLSFSPTTANGDINTPGLYTWTFRVDGFSKTFAINIFPDPTNCKDRNLEQCIGEYYGGTIPVTKTSTIQNVVNFNSNLKLGGLGYLIGTFDFSPSDTPITITGITASSNPPFKAQIKFSTGGTVPIGTGSPVDVMYGQIQVRADAPYDTDTSSRGNYTLTITGIATPYRTLTGLPITFTFTVQ
jgi:putative peptidoglycan binding protein